MVHAQCITDEREALEGVWPDKKIRRSPNELRRQHKFLHARDDNAVFLQIGVMLGLGFCIIDIAAL